MNNCITDVDILDESKECFLTFAEEVLTDRAIPAAEDGLLSSQRKILWTMEDILKMDAAGKTKKCNAVVGSTLASSYVHGDASCYGVLCKMSQKYLMRYPLIHGQGALGTQEDNDLVASSRYTEAKPSIYADLMMLDYKKHPVPTKETYNGEYMEPVVLPALFPNALCNGRQAIGISMAHSSVPHCLGEVCDAISAYIDNPALTIDDIMQYIKGPDFPLGNVIINQKDIKTALATGKSSTSLKVRGDYEIQGNKIIFTSIPYRTYRNKIKEQLEKNIDSFESVMVDFSDESNIGDNRLVFEAKPGKIDALLAKLFQYTDLQSTVSYNMNFIVNGTPKLCSVKDLIVSYVQHQHNVMINIAQVDLDKAAKKKHLLEGLIIAIKDIDAAIQLIKTSNDKAEASAKLIARFGITTEQAAAILDMKLSKLTRLDKDELLKEIEELTLAIAEYNKILGDESYRNICLKKKIADMKNEYGDERRTKIIQIAEEPKEKKEAPAIEPEKCVVIMNNNGALKRIPVTAFRTQKTNTKGIKTQDDITSAVIRTNTVDSLLVFTNKGNMYRIAVNDIPEGTNTSKGTPMEQLIAMQPGERTAVIYSLYKGSTDKYVVFVTKNGIVKKTAIEEYSQTRKKTGLAAIALMDTDELASVFLASDEDVILVSELGMMIRFPLTEIACQGRVTRGVKGITLNSGDAVLTALPVRNTNDDLAIFTHEGLGKRIVLNEIPTQRRAGKGLQAYKLPKDSSNWISAATMVADVDQLLVMGKSNSLCITGESIPVIGRTGLGNIIIKDNNILSVSKI